MKLPASRLIKGERWKVRYKWALKDDKGEHVDGLCDKKTRTIWIDKGMAKEERLETFLHEELHAVLYEICIGQTNLSENMEEIIVENIAQYLVKAYKMRLA